MKYIKPSFFETKVLPTLSKIYDETMFDTKYDFYHIKDVLNQFSSGQFQSKEWLVDELRPFLDDKDVVYVCGGWYGLMSHMIAETKTVKYIMDYELDQNCVNLHNRMKVHNNVSIHLGNGLEIFDSKESNRENRIFVCTACEHIDRDDLNSILSMKHPKLIVALQSNNMYDIDSHINCHDSLNHFIETLPEMEILYKGTLSIGDYERFMVIAR